MVGLKVLVFFTRKPGASVEAFRNHFEEHMEHLKQLAGEGFPTKHTRIYLERGEDGNAGVVYGEQSDFSFDGIVIMEFQDRAHKDLFLEKTHTAGEMSSFEENPLLPDRTKRRVCRISHISVTEA